MIPMGSTPWTRTTRPERRHYERHGEARGRLMEMVVNVLSWICLGAGSIAVLTTGIGLLRLPTLFTRIHGASVGETAGAGLVLLGLMLQAGFSLAAVKLLLVLVFLVITSPVTSHALAKVAQMHDVQPDSAYPDPTED